jgi:hypothetical protein
VNNYGIDMKNDLVQLTQPRWCANGASIYVSELRIYPKKPDYLDRWNFREHPLLTLAQKYGRLVDNEYDAEEEFDFGPDKPVTEPLTSINRSFGSMRILTSLQVGDHERIDSDPDFFIFLQLLENELRNY